MAWFIVWMVIAILNFWIALGLMGVLALTALESYPDDSDKIKEILNFGGRAMWLGPLTLISIKKENKKHQEVMQLIERLTLEMNKKKEDDE